MSTSRSSEGVVLAGGVELPEVPTGVGPADPPRLPE